MKKTPKQFVLWGTKYVPTPVKIMGGTLRECRGALKRREKEGGWVGLTILADASVKGGA